MSPNATLPLAALLAALVAPPAAAQGTDEAWRTLETEHFRLHTPVVAAPWAEHVAARLEEIRARVSAEVGPAPTTKVDIVVMDPARSPNGFAIPLSRHPRMGIFPTAPSASSGLAWYRSWSEDLVTHEDAHLVHLMRKSRSPVWRSTLSRLGVEPIIGTPAWVIEGYATVVEGRLTGKGRPHGDMRAAWLRILAADGRLPDYRALSGTAAWMGGSHPYLVGSAYLEWLELQRCAPATDLPAPGACGALPDLWARTTARKLRGFVSAFEGVFGDPPATLYDRFRAEVGHAAVDQLQGRVVDDSVWQDLSWTTAEPALSRDGTRLAALRVVERRSTLVVWDTADDPEALERWLEPHQAALEKDPDDVPAVPPAVLPREPAATREDPFRPARHPRWLPDDRVLLSVWERNEHGQLRPDLFTWDPASGRERRITHDAELTQADPSADGSWAIALRRRWGQDELVRVELTSGQVAVVTAPPVPVVLDHPRLDPSGDHVAYLEHDGQWRLVVRELATGDEFRPALPPGSSVADPAWTADGQEILVSLGQQGFIEVHAVPIDGGPLRQLTTSRGAALAPEPTPDGGSLFHLGLDSDGIDLHRIALDADRAGQPPPAGPPPVRPPVHADPPDRLQPDARSVTERAYGMGQTEWMPLLGVGGAPQANTVEAGLRFGDVVGRHEALLLGAWRGDQGIGGAALRLAWRGPPTGPGGFVHADGFWLDGSPIGARVGGNLSTGARRQGPRTRWGWQLGVYATAPTGDDPDPTQVVGHASGDAAQRLGRAWWAEPRGSLHAQTGSGEHVLVQAGVGLAVGYRGWLLDGLFHRGVATQPFHLGGLDSSLLPAAAGGTWVREPWLPVDSLSGTRRDGLTGHLGTRALGLYGARHFMATGEAAGSATSAAGLRLDLSTARQPMIRAPAMDWQAGLVCVIETDAGLDLDNCEELDGYAFWLRLGWSL